MHLFVIYIGGFAQNSLIEVHDMRFIVANTIEETYAQLRKTWWGKPESLHLDAWGSLNYADGYEVSLVSHKNVLNNPNAQNQQKLYFVNLGGYDSKQFTELHHNVFVVAPDKLTAKIKAKNQVADWEVPHADNNIEVENIVLVEECLNASGWSLELKPSREIKAFKFTCQYTPIAELETEEA